MFFIDVEIIFYIKKINLLAHLRKLNIIFQYTLEGLCCVGR